MPLIDLQIASDGPVVSLAIGVSWPRMEALRKANQPVPNPAVVRAIVDTGASCTCIDKQALTKLGVSPIGQVAVHTPSTGQKPHPHDQYDVSVILLDANDRAHLMAPAIPVIEADLSAQGIEGLLGRDILSKCILVYNGSIAAFSLAY